MDNLTSPRIIEALLDQYGVRFNKRFGQNFLIDENTVRRIVDSAGIEAEDTVLEVGPGIGTMTRILSEQAKAVVAFEIDKKLIPVLSETLADCDNVTVHQGDILKADIASVIKTPLRIVANLPYYITTPIIMGFLESDLTILGMTFMVQKEVGERLCAVPGTKAYGSLSIAAQYYANVSVDFYVPKTVFMPRPQVDSVVIHLQPGPPKIDVTDRKAFFKVVRGAFGNRRKTLMNALKQNSDYSKQQLAAAFDKTGISGSVRGEMLTGADFAKLTNALTELSEDIQ